MRDIMDHFQQFELKQIENDLVLEIGDIRYFTTIFLKT